MSDASRAPSPISTPGSRYCDESDEVLAAGVGVSDRRDHRSRLRRSPHGHSPDPRGAGDIGHTDPGAEQPAALQPRSTRRAGPLHGGRTSDAVDRPLPSLQTRDLPLGKTGRRHIGRHSRSGQPIGERRGQRRQLRRGALGCSCRMQRQREPGGDSDRCQRTEPKPAGPKSRCY